MTTLLGLLDSAVRRYGDRPALAVRHDDGSTTSWSFHELDRRARIAAWRQAEAERLTRERRPELWERYSGGD